MSDTLPKEAPADFFFLNQLSYLFAKSHPSFINLTSYTNAAREIV